SPGELRPNRGAALERRHPTGVGRDGTGPGLSAKLLAYVGTTLAYLNYWHPQAHELATLVLSEAIAATVRERGHPRSLTVAPSGQEQPDLPSGVRGGDRPLARFPRAGLLAAAPRPHERASDGRSRPVDLVRPLQLGQQQRMQAMPDAGAMP